MKKLLNRIINKLKDSKLYVVTFISAILVVSILYILNDVTPFGEKSLLCVDFFHQYGPMLGELYDRIHEGSSFLYSFSMGLGLPFFRNFFNYLSSPFNIIILLFSRDHLLTSYSFIIGLKAVASALSFVYFISHKFNKKDLYIVPLGLLYAFSAYYAAYYWNIMWLDGMVFLPLITLGIEYIIKDSKWKFYTVWLAIMLISNYFIGYMICIYSVLYFIIFSIHEFKLTKGEIKKNITKLSKSILLFILGSLTAGMIAAFALIPMYKSMQSISATGGGFPTSQYYDFTIEDYLKYHLTGAPTTTFAADEITAPNISAGILSITLIILFIINFDIPIKTKICYLLLLSFFIVAFFNCKLDFILSAFHVPNDLPYRYSFIYTFILLTIGSYAVINMKSVHYIITLIVYLFMMVLLLSISQDEWVGMNSNMIYINMIILTLYFIFYSGSKYVHDLNQVFYVALAVVAMIDVTVSINYNWDISQIVEVFYQDYSKKEQLLHYVGNIEKNNFYRVDDVNLLTLNDPSWYNYNGVTTFSSMAYVDMAELQHNLGMPGNTINSYKYAQTTPIYDLMFDIKYFIGNTNDSIRYTPIMTNDNTVNEFNYNVGLGFGVNEELKDWDYSSTSPFIVQNDFINKATNVEGVLYKIEPETSEEIYNDGSEYIVRYAFNNPKDNFYFYSEHYAVDFIIIGTVNYYKNEKYNDYDDVANINYSMLDNYGEAKIINIKSADKKIYMDIAYNRVNTNAFQVYAINHDKFEEAYNILNDNKLNITKYKENYLEANITTDNSYVYTSIPYDEGWHVYVDGNEVSTYSLANCLLTFDITPGTHKIVFKYMPVGFTLGLILSIVGITILFIDNIFKLIFKKKEA